MFDDTDDEAESQHGTPWPLIVVDPCWYAYYCASIYSGGK